MELTRWKATGCYIQGKGHKFQGTPCQDRVFSRIKDDSMVISLADGAGSCDLSQFGSKLITRSVCNFSMRNFNKLYNMDCDAIQRETGNYLVQVLDDAAKLNNSSARKDCLYTNNFCSKVLTVR
jgi:serine/threonine protein phosphatase PrpC